MKGSDQRCHKHKGQPAAAPRQRVSRRTGHKAGSSQTRTSTNRRQRSTQPGRAGSNKRPASERTKSIAAARKAAASEARRKKRIEETESFCVDIITDGWKDAVEAKVSDYVTEQAFRSLTRGRRAKSCRSLAEFASQVLKGKKWVHDVVGSAVRWLVSLLTGNWTAQVFARKLASKIPLPWDAKIIAVARGIQIIGILICVADGRDLIRCQCFTDLAVEETKSRVKQILTTALDDWQELAKFPPPANASKDAVPVATI